MSNGNGFGSGFPAPGMPGMGMGGGGLPGAPMGAPGAGFVLEIPADPTWEPFESTDVLEVDGYFSARIARESPRSDGTRTPGVFLTLEIQDEDFRGKILSKFMTDPRVTKSNTWFVWRNLLRSLTGSVDQARAAFQYSPGKLTGHVIYVKTEPYLDDNDWRTSVANFVTKQEWEEAVKRNAHRWPSKRQAGVLGGLPGGLPGMPGGLPGFPGVASAFPGLQGAPSSMAPGPAPAAAVLAAAAPAQSQTAWGFPSPAGAVPPPAPPPASTAPPATPQPSGTPVMLGFPMPGSRQ